jgi:hypothetical protein
MAPKKDESHSEHIDQIRGIIRGPQKKDFEDRFEKLDADLGQLRAELKAALEKTRDSLAA